MKGLIMESTRSRRTFIKGAAAVGCSALVGPGCLLNVQPDTADEERALDLVIEGVGDVQLVVDPGDIERVL